MSEVMNALSGSADPLENDVARIFQIGQEAKRRRGEAAHMGYEPKDIRALGVVEVISRRVRNASAGFEEVDPDESYEALVLKYPDRFTPDVIAAAQERLKLGASRAIEFRRQDIQFLVKASAIDLFGEPGIQPSAESWIGRDATLPELHKENSHADEILTKGFRGLVWLHEQEKDGERGRGLTCAVEFGPLQPGRRARVIDAVFFERPVGKELLAAHKDNGSFISRIDVSRHNRIWPISDSDVDSLLSAVRDKAHKIAQYEDQNPDPHEPLNLEKIEDATVLRQVVLRRYQSAFRQALLRKRPNRCAITGTTELSVLEAAHMHGLPQRAGFDLVFQQHAANVFTTDASLILVDGQGREPAG